MQKGRGRLVGKLSLLFVVFVCQQQDVDHPGNEESHLKDRDYGFLNSGGYNAYGNSNSGGGLSGDHWPSRKRSLKTLRKVKSNYQPN